MALPADDNPWIEGSPIENEITEPAPIEARPSVSVIRPTVPYDDIAEQAALGGALLSEASARRVAQLPADAFYVHRHRFVAQAIAEAVAKGETYSGNAVITDLQKVRGDFDEFADSWTSLGAFAISLQSNAPLIDNSRFVAEVDRLYRCRLRMHQAQRLLETAREAKLDEADDLVQTMAAVSPSKATLCLRWVPTAFDSPPQEPSTLIQGLIRKGEMCVIGAPRAIGKSMLAMNLAILCGRGRGLLAGQLPIRRQTRVLYCQGELDEWESFARWYRMCGPEGPPDNVAETFERWRLRVTNKRARNGTESVDYTDAVLDGRVEETIKQEGIELLIIDPWAVYYAGAENSNDETEAALDKLRDLTLRYGLAVVIFHHIGKTRDVTEPEDLWRGASRLADWASTRVTMLPHYTAKQAQAMNMSRQDARRFVDVHLLRRSDPTDDFSMVINHKTGWWEHWNAPTPANLIEIAPQDVVDALADSGGEWSSITEAADALDVSRQRARGAIDHAIAMGLVEELSGKAKNAKRIALAREDF